MKEGVLDEDIRIRSVNTYNASTKGKVTCDEVKQENKTVRIFNGKYTLSYL